MIMNSHLLMSKILYNFCIKELNFKLDKTAFMVGNIKPDFQPEEIKEEHNYNVSINKLVNYSKKLSQKDMSNKAYSLALGVMCHFTCDYFCLYHQEDKEKKGMVEHFIYETILHFVLVTQLLRRKITVNKNEILARKDIENIMLHNQQVYLSKARSYVKDIKFALASAALVLEYMLCYSSVEAEVSRKEQIAMLPEVVAGII